MKTEETKKQKKTRVEPKLKILEFRDEQLEHERDVLISGITVIMRRFTIEHLREIARAALSKIDFGDEIVEGGAV